MNRCIQQGLPEPSSLLNSWTSLFKFSKFSSLSYPITMRFRDHRGNQRSDSPYPIQRPTRTPAFPKTCRIQPLSSRLQDPERICLSYISFSLFKVVVEESPFVIFFELKTSHLWITDSRGQTFSYPPTYYPRTTRALNVAASLYNLLVTYHMS